MRRNMVQTEPNYMSCIVWLSCTAVVVEVGLRSRYTLEAGALIHSVIAISV